MATASIGNWQAISKIAREARDKSIDAVKPPIPRLDGDLPLDVTHYPREILSKDEIRITETPPEKLATQMASGLLSCTSVTKAFLRRAALAQQLVNCITELLPNRALTRAKYLDEYYATHKKPVGPLHGLPISVKEHIGMKGLGVNAGFVSWWEHKASKDAHVLRILWDAGAVFYARTTQPQTLMHLETASCLYGTTVNPFNRNLTSGGSSGGEGALMGLRGSCLGIGSDIGGSIRSPAANNGVFGLRPTSSRIPLEGFLATMEGQDHIIPVVGPLSTSLGGIKLWVQTILDAKPWLVEPSLIPIPWRAEETIVDAAKPLRIGIMWTDGVITPHPPITRALRAVSSKLKSLANVTEVEWTPYKHEEAWSIIASLYFCDGGAEESAAIDASGEPWLPLSKHILKDNPWVKDLSIAELWEWQGKREKYRAEYAAKWNAAEIDVLLCPAGPSVAPMLETAKWWGYTSLFNLLDLPALVFGVGRVDPELDKKDQVETLSEKDEEHYKLYSPEAYQGAPISLQLVARRYEDEKLIGILEYLEDALELPFVCNVSIAGKL